MIDLSEPELEILNIWNEQGIEYLIIGGCAMRFFGMKDRIVQDVDVWIDTSSIENAKKLHESLTHLGYPIKETIEQFRESKKHFQVGYSYVEVLTAIDGIAFNAAYAARQFATESGLTLSVVSAEDLLRIKTDAAKNPKRAEKEQADIEYLEKFLGKRS